MNSNNQWSRRQWLKTLAGSATGFIFFKNIEVLAEDKVAKESDPIAQGFKYCESVKSGSCTVKDKGADATCKSCTHYNKDNKEKKIAAKIMGSCVLMQNAYVASTGICSLYAKKS